MDKQRWTFSYCYYLLVHVSFLYLKKRDTFFRFCVIMASFTTCSYIQPFFILGSFPNVVRFHEQAVPNLQYNERQNCAASSHCLSC